MPFTVMRRNSASSPWQMSCNLFTHESDNKRPGLARLWVPLMAINGAYNRLDFACSETILASDKPLKICDILLSIVTFSYETFSVFTYRMFSFLTYSALSSAVLGQHAQDRAGIS